MKRIILCCLTAGLAGLVNAQTPTQYSQSVSNDRPVFYWNFDGGSGPASQQMPLSWAPATSQNDLIPTTTNLSMRVSHTSLADGLALTNAAVFDGTNSFGVTGLYLPTTQLRGPYAVEMWMRADGNAQQNGQYLIGFGNGSPGIIYNYNQYFLELYAGAGGRTGLSGPAITDTNWHHILFVYYGNGTDGVADRVDAYVDGVDTSIPGAGITAPANLQTIHVGAADAAGDNPFTGDLDEVAIYDLSQLTSEAAVTAAVSAMVTNHIAAATAGDYDSQVLADQPLLYWNFDEASGNARQLAPVTFTQALNQQNNLAPVGSAGYVSHASIGSGLQLGDAVDLNGTNSFQSAAGLLGGSTSSLTGPWAMEFWFQLAGNESQRYFVNVGGNNRPALIYGYNGQRIEAYGAGLGRSGNNGVSVADQNWHHLLVVNYDNAPANSTNRVDFFLDGVQFTNVGGGFNTPVNFAGGLIFGAADAGSSSGFDGRLDELAIYNLSADTNVLDIESNMAAMDARHYAAAFGTTNVGIITITQQPTNAVGQIGQTSTFTVVATVTGTASPLVYQWQRNGVSIGGATNASFTTAALTLNDIGTNTYLARVSAGPAFKFSDTVTLALATPPPAPATAYSQAVANDNPLLYWNFDEMTGPAVEQVLVTNKPVTDENDLVPVGAGLYRTTHASLSDGLDKLGSAMEFDGASYMIANATRLGESAATGPWAIEFWVQTPGASGAYIANFGGASGNTPAVIYGFNPNQLELYGAGAGGRTGTNGPAFSDANWHHVLWVNYNNAPAGSTNRVDVYLDGVLSTNVGGGFNRPIDLTHFLIGAASTTPDNGFTGGLDELAVYDWKGLSAAQIADKAQNIATNHFAVAHTTNGPSYAATVLADQPILYYNFDETNGNALQLAPVTLPPVVATNNNLLASNGAGRAQQSGLNLGNTAEFGGFGYYDAAQLNAGRPTLSPPWALEFWMQTPGQANGAYLMSFDNDNLGHGAPSVIFNYGAPGALNLFVNPNNQTASGVSITDSNWHHVMWVDYGDGVSGVADRVDLYLDNVCYSNVQNTFSSSLNLSGGLLLGASSPGYDQFVGQLDEVAIYDLSALTNENDITLRAQQMVADHIAMATNTPPPTMSAGWSGGQLTLTWPGNGYIVQTNGDLSNSAGWSDVSGATNSPVVITPTSTGTLFFRLRQQ